MKTHAENRTPAPSALRGTLGVGALALMVYMLTVSRGAYPGPSTSMIAYAAGLLPEMPSAHPVWQLIVRTLAHVSIFSLPLRLNLFSACCAAGSVSLLGWVVARILYAMAIEKEGKVVLPEITAHNRRAVWIAALAGWCAAIAFAFSVPVWSAATRLHTQSFELLLLLAAVATGLQYGITAQRRHLIATATLCGIGCVECFAFLPATIVMMIILLYAESKRTKHWETPLLLILAFGVLGAIAAVALLWAMRHPEATSFRAVIGALLRGHYVSLRLALPRVGWAWLIGLSFLPLTLAFACVQKAFRKGAEFIALYVLCTVAAGLCLFNADFSPWGMARAGGYLPVMTALAVAATVGCCVAYWLMLCERFDWREHGGSRSRSQSIDRRITRVMGLGFGLPLIAAVFAAVPLNLRESDGRNGAFADTVAGHVLQSLGPRDWLVSGGWLDNNLLILAREQARPLHLLALSTLPNAERNRQLVHWIETDAAFRARRQRMLNAASLGATAFVREWMSVDATVDSRMLTLGAPDSWRLADWRPVPLGFVFTGTRRLEQLNATGLLDTNRVFWSFIEKTVPAAQDPGLAPVLIQTRRSLRRQASVAADNLGVLLEDLARPAEASEAYAEARHLDPDNLSALLNQIALAEGHDKTHELPRLKRDLEALSSRYEGKEIQIPALVSAYGEIRQPAFHALQGRAWLRQGQPLLARAELSRTLDVAPDNQAARFDLAMLHLSQGDPAASERAYREALAADPNAAPAMIGMANATTCLGHADAALAWIERARKAGATESLLAIPEASALAAAGRRGEALARLRAVTEAHPENIEAWSLLAGVLSGQDGGLTEIEQRVLPAMIKAVGKGDHVLIHLVRAQVIRGKRPVDYPTARNALLHALTLRPDLVDVRSDLLNLDFQSRNPAFIEQDAAQVLRQAPDDALANYLLATVQMGRGEWTAAEDRLQRSVAAAPSAFAYNDLAETLRQQHRLADAEQAARQALALNPASPLAWDTLGCTLLEAGRIAEASQAVEKSLSLAATDPRVHMSLARVRIAQGRPQDAKRILRDAAAKFGALPPPLCNEFSALEKKL